MGLRAEMRRVPDAVLTLLEPGEQCAAGCRVMAPFAGAQRIVEPPRPAAPARRPRPWYLWPVVVVVTVLTYGGPSFGDGFDRLLGGVAVRGDASSLGVRLFRSLHRLRRTGYLVVTERRVLLVEATSVRHDDVRLMFDVPRADVAHARRRGRLMCRGRVEVSFADGSMSALATGIVGSAAATRLVDALEAGRVHTA